MLNKKNIKTVLTVAAGLPVAYPPESKSGIYHKTYLALDIESYKISKHFADTFQQIELNRKRGGVLVHCAAGVSRSASVVIAYLMRKNNMGFQAAYNYVKQRRPVICPNYGFMRELRNFETQLKQNKDPQQNEKQKVQEEEEKVQKVESKNPVVLEQFSAKKNTYNNNLAKPFQQYSVNKYDKQKNPIFDPNIVTYSQQNKLLNSKLGQQKTNPYKLNNRLY